MKHWFVLDGEEAYSFPSLDMAMEALKEAIARRALLLEVGMVNRYHVRLVKA